MKSRVSEGRGVKSLTYPKVKPNVTFCLCWRSSGAEQLPCKQWVGGSNPPASASFFEELPGAAGGFGEVPKWPKGADCKSAGVRLRGIKASPPHPCSRSLETGPDVGARIHRRSPAGGVRAPRRPAARTALTIIATANGRA